MKIRVQKYLSESGVSSRREGEKLILCGRVKVNGKVVSLGDTMDPLSDTVVVDGKKIQREKKAYYLLYKPRGYVTTTKDPEGRKTVMDLLKNISGRVYPVGRLDYETEGLLIFTNDGALTNGLTHPRHHIRKVYKVRVRGSVKEEDVLFLREGVVLDDGYKTKPAEVYILEREETSTLLEVTIYEGRNRQVRKMFESIGHRVERLTRTGIGSIHIGKMKRGEIRPLTKTEVDKLRNFVHKIPKK